MNKTMLEAIKLTLGHEGGYSNNPADRGGETYMGISRVNWPDWEGWSVIDEVKATKPANLDKALKAVPGLDARVEAFYRANFWPLWMDNLPPALAIEVFDAGVNHGVSRAAKFLQHSINLLNSAEQITKDIDEDGKPGPGTMAAFDAVVKKRGFDLVLKTYKLLRGKLFIELCEKDPRQEIFLAGWLNNRVRL